MQIFEYPYVIITVLAMIFLLMGLIGLYFTIKSVRTVKGTAEKSFCGIGKLENEFEKAANAHKNRCVVYVAIHFDGAKRLFSESKVNRMYEQIKTILFNHFCINTAGEISLRGQESFVVYSSLKSEEIVLTINNCSKEINQVFIDYGAVNLVHINFGYHITASAEVNFKTALARAKQACSIANDRRDLYCEWDSANGREFERKIKIENNIQNEIDNNRFFLEYQPILDLKTNEIIAAEVLARLNSSTEGILTPRSFLSAVNNVGLNQKFDYYIFEKNCKWIASDKENRMKCFYTINFSRYTLSDPNLAQNVINVIEKYGIDYSCIAIEILEDKNLNPDEKAVMVKNLSILKQKGILTLLDDFGKGYANFGDLKDFDISIVKIDKTITQNANNQAGSVILKNIVKTAHDLGFKTLCEGIETEEMKKAVIESDCDMLQGYFFHRPMPVAQFEVLIKK